jgi:quercetin dioxygenase-like cupin family protein
MNRPEDPRTPIDPDIAEALARDTHAEPLAPATAARIKHRVLERIARADRSHTTIQASDNTWQPFAEGIRIKVLHEDAGIMSYLLELAPGAVIAPHRHPVDEECVVLAGTLKIGDDLLVPAGGFHLAHRGALHAPVTTLTGATIYLRGAAPEVAQLL